MSSPHSALTSDDIQLLFEAVDRDGTVRVGPEQAGVRDGAKRLAACGYLEGGPDVFRVTRAGQEYAESMM
jgi:hypothetical protein